jgi:hypothetical protein
MTHRDKIDALVEGLLNDLANASGADRAMLTTASLMTSSLHPRHDDGTPVAPFVPEDTVAHWRTQGEKEFVQLDKVERVLLTLLVLQSMAQTTGDIQEALIAARAASDCANLLTCDPQFTALRPVMLLSKLDPTGTLGKAMMALLEDDPAIQERLTQMGAKAQARAERTRREA